MSPEAKPRTIEVACNELGYKNWKELKSEIEAFWRISYTPSEFVECQDEDLTTLAHNYVKKYGDRRWGEHSDLYIWPKSQEFIEERVKDILRREMRNTKDRLSRRNYPQARETPTTTTFSATPFRDDISRARQQTDSVLDLDDSRSSSQEHESRNAAHPGRPQNNSSERTAYTSGDLQRRNSPLRLDSDFASLRGQKRQRKTIDDPRSSVFEGSPAESDTKSSILKSPTGIDAEPPQRAIVKFRVPVPSSNTLSSVQHELDDIRAEPIKFHASGQLVKLEARHGAHFAQRIMFNLESRISGIQARYLLANTEKEITLLDGEKKALEELQSLIVADGRSLGASTGGPEPVLIE